MNVCKLVVTFAAVGTLVGTLATAWRAVRAAECEVSASVAAALAGAYVLGSASKWAWQPASTCRGFGHGLAVASCWWWALTTPWTVPNCASHWHRPRHCFALVPAAVWGAAVVTAHTFFYAMLLRWASARPHAEAQRQRRAAVVLTARRPIRLLVDSEEDEEGQNMPQQ